MNYLNQLSIFLLARSSVLVAAVLMFALVGLYILVEPVVIRSQVFDQFTVTQNVTAEISFAATAADVTMSSSIPGITGGTANGSTQVRVYTNNSTGYTMTIAASNTPALQGFTGGSISDYTPATAGTPDYVHSVGANTGEFAYTISASATTDLAQKFLDNGAACNTGSADTSGATSCWYGLSTTATSTITRGTQTPASGATTTIFFRTEITSNPVPAITEDTYVATTTLTATAN